MRKRCICSFIVRLDPLGIELFSSSSMFRSTVLFIVLLFLFDVCLATNELSCQSHVDKLANCQAVISFSGDCQSSKIDLSQTEYSQCQSVNFFWSYPLNNMTLIIETPFTRSHQQYTMFLDNQQLAGAISHVYRIFNNQEIDVTTRDPTLIQYSDSNYQIILKFEGPTRLSRYGVNIDYQTKSM